jgi:hypothetical protein
MQPKTLSELYDAVKEKRIKVAYGNNKKFRLFIATNDHLCYFKPKSSRRGYVMDGELFKTLVKFEGAESPRTEDEKLKKQYNVIAKYRKMAMVASFTNSFIKDCKALPATFEEWVKEGKKGLYESGITTGNGIDGKVISLDRIAKKYPYDIKNLREAIKNQKAGTYGYRMRFSGYDMSLSTQNSETAVGEFMGYLSLEFKNCGNGYYYLLINDDNFIGYDVD